MGQRDGSAEPDARDGERHRRRCLGHGVHPAVRLPAGMCQLHPDAVAVLLRCGRPVAQGRASFRILWPLDDDVARMFQMTVVHLHVAGQHQAGALPGPRAVQPGMGRRCAMLAVGEQFAHRSFDQSIGQRRPARQHERCTQAGGSIPIHGHASRSVGNADGGADELALLDDVEHEAGGIARGNRIAGGAAAGIDLERPLVAHTRRRTPCACICAMSTCVASGIRSFGLPSPNPPTPRYWTTASAPCRTSPIALGSRASPLTTVAPAGAWSALACERASTATRCPRSSALASTARPPFPVDPRTTRFMPFSKRPLEA